MADEYGEYGSWCNAIDLDHPATTTTIPIPGTKIDGKSSVSTGLQQQQQQQHQRKRKNVRNPYQKEKKTPTRTPTPLSIASNPWTKILLFPCFLVKDLLVYFFGLLFSLVHAIILVIPGQREAEKIKQRNSNNNNNNNKEKKKQKASHRTLSPPVAAPSIHNSVVLVANASLVSTRVQRQQPQKTPPTGSNGDKLPPSMADQQQQKQQKEKKINPLPGKSSVSLEDQQQQQQKLRKKTTMLHHPCENNNKNSIVNDSITTSSNNGAAVVHVMSTAAVSTGVHAIHNPYINNNNNNNNNKNSSNKKKRKTPPPPFPLLPCSINGLRSSSTHGHREGNVHATANNRTIKRKRNIISNDDDDNNNNNKKKNKITPPLQTTNIDGGSVKLTEFLLVSLLVKCLEFLDRESLRIACRLSKQFKNIIYSHNNGTELDLVPLLQIRNKLDSGRTQRLIMQLCYHHGKLQRYREIKIIDGFKFLDCTNYQNRLLVDTRGRTFFLKGVVSLHSLSNFSSSLPKTLAWNLPNLREVNLSDYTRFSSDTIEILSKNCSSLEKIALKGKGKNSVIKLDGDELSSAKNLKGLYMDNFYMDHTMFLRYEDEDTLDSNIFVFHKCSSKRLERVSIKNARFCDKPLSQKTLIKFVRNAPSSLRWFRSNMTKENIDMLRSERPEIDLVN